jgi:tetratricopeptide (TPR) repeat protein
MKRTTVVFALAAMVLFLALQSFECASSDFTGAKMRIQQRNYQEAVPLLEKEVKNNPTNEEAWYLLGAVKSDLEDYDGMNTAFTQALKISPVHSSEIHGVRFSKWGQHINSGVNLLERASSDSVQYYEKSIVEFQKSIKAWPDTGLTFRYLGYAYNNKGELDKAQEAYLKAWSLGDEAESAKRAGLIYLHQGQELKSKFENDSVNAVSMRSLKNLERIRKGITKGDVIAAVGTVNPKDVTKGPKGTKKEDWKYPKYNLSLSFDNEKLVAKKFDSPFNPKIDSTQARAAFKKFAAATDILEEARKKDPKDPEIINFLMQAYINADRITAAITTFREQVKNEPLNKQNHYVLGVLLRSASKFDEAVTEFLEALKIDPNFADAAYDIGATYYNWGVDIIHEAEEKGVETKAYLEKFEKSLPFMEKVSEQKKDDPQIWETLGTIYARLGKTDKATKAFEIADKLRQGK